MGCEWYDISSIFLKHAVVFVLKENKVQNKDLEQRVKELNTLKYEINKLKNNKIGKKLLIFPTEYDLNLTLKTTFIGEDTVFILYDDDKITCSMQVPEPYNMTVEDYYTTILYENEIIPKKHDYFTFVGCGKTIISSTQDIYTDVHYLKKIHQEGDVFDEPGIQSITLEKIKN